MIYLSDVGRAVPQLSDNLRGLPFDTLFPVVLDRIIDHQALVAAARRQHLDDDPVVRRDIEAATSRLLEGALLAREAVTKIQARYARQYAGKPATEETRARRILVSTEDEAKRLIAELSTGADFPTLARQNSKDPDRENGGDLGFFRHDQVWPEFADVAFALPPGQFSQAPIHNEFGWHVVKVEELRIVAPPAFPTCTTRYGSHCCRRLCSARSRRRALSSRSANSTSTARPWGRCPISRRTCPW